LKVSVLHCVAVIQSVEISAWRSLCVRVQTGRGDVIWLHVVMRMCADDVTGPRIVCISQLIDETEALTIRANVAYDDAGAPPHDMGLLRGPHGFLDGLFNDDGKKLYAAGTKRRVTGSAAACSPAKVARQADRMLDDGCLMSMPSPPISHGGNPPELAMSGGSTSMMYSVTPCPGDGFLNATTELPFIPESFLTPTASPCSFTGSPAPVQHPVLLSDQQDWNAAADLAAPNAEELSFFDHAGLYDQSAKPRTIIGNEDKLPELDLPTVTSYLDCLEQSNPLMQMALIGGQHSSQPLGGLGYSRAPPVGVGVDAGVQLQQKTSTIDEELIQSLFSTANSFLSSVTSVKPFEFAGSELLFAHC